MKEKMDKILMVRKGLLSGTHWSVLYGLNLFSEYFTEKMTISMARRIFMSIINEGFDGEKIEIERNMFVRNFNKFKSEMNIKLVVEETTEGKKGTDRNSELDSVETLNASEVNIQKKVNKLFPNNSINNS